MPARSPLRKQGAPYHRMNSCSRHLSSPNAESDGDFRHNNRFGQRSFRPQRQTLSCLCQRYCQKRGSSDRAQTHGEYHHPDDNAPQVHTALFRADDSRKKPCRWAGAFRDNHAQTADMPDPPTHHLKAYALQGNGQDQPARTALLPLLPVSQVRSFRSRSQKLNCEKKGSP